MGTSCSFYCRKETAFHNCLSSGIAQTQPWAGLHTQSLLPPFIPCLTASLRVLTPGFSLQSHPHHSQIHAPRMPAPAFSFRIRGQVRKQQISGFQMSCDSKTTTYTPATRCPGVFFIQLSGILEMRAHFSLGWGVLLVQAPCSVNTPERQTRQ